MMSRWYLVKQNWSATKQSLGLYITEQFSGLGGDIWPIDSSEAQSNIESRRDYIEIDKGFEIYVVTDSMTAESYYTLAKEKNLEPILLELSVPGTSDDVHGYDFGNPEGGFSIIETELISSDDCDELIEKYLNKDYGLFGNVSLLHEYIHRLDTDSVEELADFRVVGIKVLS